MCTSIYYNVRGFNLLGPFLTIPKCTIWNTSFDILVKRTILNWLVYPCQGLWCGAIAFIKGVDS